MMPVDGSTVSTVLIAAAGVLGWLYTQTQARSKEQRGELKWRRRLDSGRTRYIYRLEQELNKRDIPLPQKPEDLVEAEGEEW